MSFSTIIDIAGPYTITTLPQTLSVAFPFQQASDLVVYNKGTAGTPVSPPVILTLNSDYTVTGGGYDGSLNMQTGSVVVAAGGAGSLAAGDIIYILRSPANNQLTSFLSTGSLTIPMIEQALDKAATVSQALQDQINASLRIPVSEGGSGVTPAMSSAARAGLYVSFDASGNLALVDVVAMVSPYATSAAASAATATTQASVAAAEAGIATTEAGIATTQAAAAAASAAAAAATVGNATKLNGQSLAALATGILKNTTGTGVPSIAVAADFPTLNQNTSGTAANLSGTPALPNGTTATTQASGDNSTKLATTAYADTKAPAYAPLSTFTTALAEAGAIARGLTITGIATGTASTSLISMTNHDRAVGDKVTFSSLTGGAGLSTSTPYYVIANGLTANVFKLSATVGGSAIVFSTDITAAGIIFYSRRVNVIQIGDSTGADIFENGPFNIAHAAYGFGGLQNILSNYGGGNLTLTNVSYNSTRVNSMIGQYSMDTSGATVEVFPDEYYFSQVPNPSFSGHVFPPQNLTGFRVVWIKGSGSFKIQHSAYNYYGDSLWVTPTWVDDVTVDTSTGSAPIQKMETTLPAGLYRCRIIQTAGTPQLAYWGFLGASGFNRGGCYGQGGDYLSNYLLTPAANWAAHLAASAPDLITLQFKNNGADTLSAWTTQLNTLVGYINSYAPAASVCLVGNYNSQSDDSYSGPNMTMPQQRVLLQSVAATNGWAYIDASQVLGATYAIAAANGVMNDTVHSNDAGKAALTGYFSQLAKMFTAGDCLPPYQPRVTGVTPGVYTGNGLSITVDPAGKITAASTPAQTPNYFSKTIALDISAIGGSSQTLTFSASDDGAVYLVTTGTKILNFTNSTTQRDGFNVTLIKVDTGSGYIAQLYQTPYVGTCGQKGDGVRVMQASSSSFVETFAAAWAAGGSGAAAGSGAGRFTQGSGAPPSGAAIASTLYSDYSNHVAYVCTGTGTSPTWTKLATCVGTLAVASGKTFTSSNTLTLTGTDGSSLAIGTGGTFNRLRVYTVGTLPAGTQGDTALVTDAVIPTYLGALTGGGSVVTPVFYNGSAWLSY